MARDSRHFFDMKVEMIKTSIKVKYKLKIGSQLDVYITVSTWQHFKSFKRYKKLKKCARSAQKNLVRGGTKVRMGGTDKFLTWGGTGLDGGGRPLDGGGGPPHPPP